MIPDDIDLVLALSGGNALGAYHAGAYEALHQRSLMAGWVAGGSAGAINGALICGNAPSDRLNRLRTLWAPSCDATFVRDPGGVLEDTRRFAAAAMTAFVGQPGIFAPKYLSWLHSGFAAPERASLYDTLPLRASLERLVDFDLLNAAASPRLSATAVDVETGEDVVFDTRDHPLAADHLRASAALLPVFPPVEIAGRSFADAGISANLPLDCILAEPGERPLLCLALDLLPLAGMRPGSVTQSLLRMQDLMFGTQSRRAIAAWQAIFEERARNGKARPITLVHLAYSGEDREVSAKAFDFSPRSAADRWQAGLSAMADALDDIASGAIELRKEAGLSVYARTGQTAKLRRTYFPLAPSPAPGPGAQSPRAE
ncbi:patatin-like phospholipase family protein [Novosphingobium gossypii]|uniref:patatin-like phospholipase family protein n=1 Tax=Novosphingobium gossypii TaxID=1604774 RepID=UPI003D20AC95